MPLSSTGWQVTTIASAFIAIIVAGQVIAGMAAPNGELPVMYTLDTCVNTSASFSVAGRGAFKVFPFRPFVASELPSSGCPSTPLDAGTVDITLEETDGGGWRPDAKYHPTFFLPTGHYALISFEVLDKGGATIQPAETIQIGPNAAYPWAAEPSRVSVLAGESLARPDPGCTCTDGCAYANDGSCDDGGADSVHSLCALGTDCSDCGGQRCPSGATSRRTLFGRGAGLASSADGAWEAQVEEEAAAMDMAAEVAPGARRLLKGGGGGVFGGGGSRGTGGRPSSSGAARWGSSAPASRSYSSSTTTSYQGSSYGGRSSYSAGGSSYYTGSRGYSYNYGSRSIGSSATIVFIGRSHYGCYSCGYRTCYSCGSCRSRSACAHEKSGQTSVALDRYEMDFGFKAAGFPLTLRVYNYTAFASTSASSSTGYATFTTSEADGLETASAALLPIGFIGVFLAFGYAICNSSRMFTRNRPMPTKPHNFSLQPVQPSMQMAQYPQGGSAYPQAGYGQPMGQYPQAGYGQPMAVAQPMTTAYPQAGGYPQAAGYPSAPPSPPDKTE